MFAHSIPRPIRAAMALSVLLFSPTLGQARKTGKPVPPLPSEVLMAKSVYLDCRLGMPDIPSAVTLRIEQWGRFRIENRPENADLVLSIGDLKGYTVILNVSDRTYHRVFWSTTAEGGNIRDRCIQSIDLFRQRIEADEARLRQAQPTPKQP
jgi:hypothetical protein